MNNPIDDIKLIASQLNGSQDWKGKSHELDMIYEIMTNNCIPMADVLKAIEDGLNSGSLFTGHGKSTYCKNMSVSAKPRLTYRIKKGS